MATPPFLSRLRERKLAQWAVAYLAGGWLLLEVTGFLADAFGWPISIVRASVALVGAGFLAVLVVAWYHGEKGRQYVSGPELLLLTFVLLIAAIGIAAATRSSPFEAMVQPAKRASSPRELTFSGNAWHSALSPDGRFVAYSALADSGEMVVVQDRAGGAADTLLTVGAVSGLDWSPDGSRLVVSGFDQRTLNGAIGIVHRSGGPVRWLHAATEDRSNIPIAHWHPDGRHVELRTSDFTRLLRVHVETEDTVSVPIPGEHDVFDGWSRDESGTRLAIAVAWSPPYRSEVLVLRPNGESEILHRDSASILWLRWIDNRIYFSRDQREIWRIDVDESGSRIGEARKVLELDALPAGWELVRFSLTADGRAFSYTRGRRYTNLVRVQFTGGGIATTELTRGTASLFGTAVSPDGTTIAFAMRAGGTADIFLVSSSGGSPRQLTQGARVTPGSDLAWSPEGTRIAFSSTREDGTYLWLADVGSGRIIRPGGREIGTNGMIGWAPSGDIVHVAPVPSGTMDNQLLRLDPDSGTQEAVIEHGWMWNPEIGPDGEHVAVLWLEPPTRNGTTGFWVVDLDRRTEPSIVPAFGFWPDGWSADGRYLYVSFYKPVAEFYRVELARGAAAVPEPFLDLPFRVTSCKPIPTSRAAFVCLAEDFVSDIALIDDFDP